MAPFGSMVTTASRPRAASAAEAAGVTPSTATGAVSKPVTAWPAAARFFAMGAPMLPRPMKPIRMASSPQEPELVAAPSGASMAATSSGRRLSMSSRQTGLRSLSITAARMPSRSSPSLAAREVKRYSRRERLLDAGVAAGGADELERAGHGERALAAEAS